MTSRTVLLYGQSLLLSSVAASLAQNPGLCVAQAGTWDEVSTLLAEGVPDVVIFDLTHAAEGRMLSLLVQNPQLLMIGLNAERNQAVLLSGQETEALTMSRIRELVRRGDEP